MLNGFASYIIPHASAAADAVVESRSAFRASRARVVHAPDDAWRASALGSSSEAVRCYGYATAGAEASTETAVVGPMSVAVRWRDCSS